MKRIPFNMLSRIWLYLLVPVLVVSEVCADENQGASVDESQIDVVLYVSPSAKRVEENTGTDVTKPLARFGRAVELAKTHLDAGRGVRIELGAGIYREHIFIQGPWSDAAQDAVLVIQGDSAENTVLKGSVSEGFEPDTWKPVEGYPGVFEHSWDQKLAPFAGPWVNIFDDHDTLIRGAAQRGEFLVVNDRVLRQVALEQYDWVDPDGASGISEQGITDKENKHGWLEYRGLADEGLGILDEPWTFAVADHEKTDPELRGRIFMRLPEGLRVQDLGLIEASAPRVNELDWPAHYMSSPLTIIGKHNLVVRRLTVTHGNTHLVGAAFHLGQVRNALIEDCRVIHNSGTGLKAGKSSHVTIRRCAFNHNGYAGLKPPGTYSLVEDSEMCFNNVRGDWGAFRGVDAAGMKVGRADHLTFRRCVAIGNRTHGFWDDVFSKSVTFDRCLSYANYRVGFFIELSGSKQDSGDALVKDCISIANGGNGINVLEYRRPTVDGAVLGFNNGAQLRLMDFKGRFPNGTEADSITIRDTHLISDGTSPLVAVMGFPPFEFMQVMTFSNNRYSIPQGAPAFKKGQTRYSSFEAWRKVLGESGAQQSGEAEEDLSTRWTASSILVHPESPVVMQAKQWGVPLPASHLRRAADLLMERRANTATYLRQPRYGKPWPLASNAKPDRFSVVDLSEHATYNPESGEGVIRLAPGWYKDLEEIYGVPVRVPLGRNSAVAMPSKKFTEDGQGRELPAEVKIPIHQSVQALYLLHGASYVGVTRPIGAYALVYEDGTEHEVDVVAGGKMGFNDQPGKNDALYGTLTPNIKDWYHPTTIHTASTRPVPAKMLEAFVEKTANIYQYELVNPHPEKTVKALRMTSDTSQAGRFILFSATALLHQVDGAGQ